MRKSGKLNKGVNAKKSFTESNKFVTIVNARKSFTALFTALFTA